LQELLFIPSGKFGIGGFHFYNIMH
jgi:hypothetical protein